MPAPSSPRILILGSLNADLITTTPRMPAAGETLTATSFQTAPGGKGANQAVACARLSQPGSKNVRMRGAVGADAFGPLLTDELAASGVDIAGVAVVEDGTPTGTAVIIVDAGTGENRILFTPGANGAVAPTAADGEQRDGMWKGVKAVVLQLEVPVGTVMWALSEARKRGIVTVFNPAPAIPDLPGDCYGKVDWLIVNETEAAILTGVDVSVLDSSEGVEVAAAELLSRGAGAVIVTLGERGCFWSVRDGAKGWQEVTVKKEDVVDTTGAGDTFVGALAVGVVEGKSAEEAVKWAGVAAGAAVKKRGAMAGVPWRREVESQ